MENRLQVYGIYLSSKLPDVYLLVLNLEYERIFGIMFYKETLEMDSLFEVDQKRYADSMTKIDNIYMKTEFFKLTLKRI